MTTGDRKLNRRIKAIQAQLDALLSKLPADEGKDLTPELEKLSQSLEILRKQNEERVAAQRLLDVEHRRYQALFAFTPDSYLMTDGEGVIQEANPAAMKLFDVQDTQLTDKSLLRFEPQEDREDFYAQIRSLHHHPGNWRLSWHTHLQTEEGKPFYAALTVGPMKDEKGKLVGLCWLVRDVTERRQEEEAQRKLTLRIQAGLRAGNLAWWEMELPSGKVTFDDPKAEMLGFAPDRFETYEDFTALLHPDDYDTAMQAMQEHLDGKVKNYEVDYRIQTRQGTYKWFRDVGGIVEPRVGSDAISVIGLVEDITERKEAQQKLEQYAAALKRSNEELEQFGYVVSHDLREPLRMVASYLELLETRYRDDLDERANVYIDFAVDGAERMQAMIRALLDLSRVETHGQAFVPVDTETVLAHTLTSLGPRIAETDAEITHDPLPTVMADEAQLAQVFQNLIANAIKFRREGVPPRVHVAAGRVPPSNSPRGGEDSVSPPAGGIKGGSTDGCEWCFSVTDNGIGIDPEQADRLFRIFQRLHTADEYPGLGLGLALCKRIVTRHGGRIWIESEPGRGATFTFTLPTAKEGHHG